MNRWDEMQRATSRSIEERILDLEWLLENGSLDQLQHVLDRGWLKTKRDVDAFMACSPVQQVPAALRAVLLEFARSCSANETPDHDVSLSVDPFEDDDSVGGLWKTAQMKDGTLRIDSYLGCDEDVVVPDQIGGIPVTAIHENAFRRTGDVDSVARYLACLPIRTLRIPGSIAIIPGSLVRDLPNLEFVKLLDGVEVIGTSAFADAPALRKVVLPKSVRQIRNYAFFDSRNLEAVDGLRKGIEYGKSILWGTRVRTPKFAVPSEPAASECAFDAKLLARRVHAALARGESGRFDRLEVPFEAIRAGDRECLDRLLEDGWATDWYDFYLLHSYAVSHDEDPEILDSIDAWQQRRGASEEGQDRDLVFWHCRTRHDGSLEITSYEGDDPCPVIPSRIGRRYVTSVADHAFNNRYCASGMLRTLRDAVTSITFPGTMQYIASFLDPPWYLESVRFEEGVECIGTYAFGCACHLRTVHCPSTLKEIHSCAFRHAPVECITGLPDNVCVGRDAFSETYLPGTDQYTVIGNRICAADGHPRFLDGSAAVPRQLDVTGEVLTRMPPLVYRSPARVADAGSIAADIAPGDITEFGVFPKEKDLEKRPLAWRCIARDGNRALLMTDRVVTELPAKWLRRDQHDAYRWLADTFEKLALRSEERAQLIARPPRTAGSIPAGVFLPTVEEVKQYLPYESRRQCALTPYARMHNTPSMYEDVVRRPSWCTASTEDGDPIIVDCETGMFRADDCSCLHTSRETVLFGLRPWAWVTVGADTAVRSG